MNSVEPKFSIVTVNYNNAPLLIECLSKTLAAISLLQYEIIIVDNVSTDDSYEVLATHYRDNDRIKVIRTEYNGGFGYGCNYGAKSSTSSILWFLNSDAWVVSVDALDDTFALLQNRDTGVVGMSVCLNDGTPAPQGSGSLTFVYLLVSSFRLGLLYRWLPTPIRKILGHLLKPMPGPIGQYVNSFGHSENKSVFPSGGAGGGTFLINKAVYKQIGGFDEKFFLYDEDSDLCQRLVNAGFTHYIDPRLIVHTYLSATTSKLSSSHLKNIKFKSRKLLINKHFFGIKRATLLFVTRLTWRLL